MIKKVFIIPCAGGTSITFSRWHSFFPDNIELHLYDYPGRGLRAEEMELESLDSIVDDFSIYIEKNLIDYQEPYSIFGYSMGALIAYESYYTLLERSKGLPELMIFAACESAQTFSIADVSQYKADELISYMQKIGSLPKTLSKDLYYIGDDIKHDLQLLSRYSYSEQIEKIKSYGVIMRGIGDKICQVNIKEWQELFENTLNYVDFSGGHFFIKEAEQEVTSYIYDLLSRVY